MSKITKQEIIYYGGVLIGAYVFCKFLFEYVAPFVFAYILSLILYPFYKTLAKKLNKSLSSVLTCVILIVLLVLLSKTIVSRVISEGKAFAVNIPYYTHKFTTKLEQFKLKYNYIIDIIPQNAKSQTIKSMQTGLLNFLNNIVANKEILKTVPEFFINIVITIISTFFLLRDREQISNFCKQILPDNITKLLTQLKMGCAHGLMTYIKAESILMTVTGCICTIGFCVIQYPYALFLGLFTALIDALPILGTGLILWPWTAYSFMSGDLHRAIILLITYSVVIVTRHILSPKLISRQIGVHPLVMIISIYIGLKLLGIVGMILGPIIIITMKLRASDINNDVNVMKS